MTPFRTARPRAAQTNRSNDVVAFALQSNRKQRKLNEPHSSDAEREQYQ